MKLSSAKLAFFANPFCKTCLNIIFRQSRIMRLFRHGPLRALLRAAGRIVGTALIGLRLLQPALGGVPNDHLLDVWTVENGLPSSSVTSVAQTPDGYLWIGTFNGLARFDGIRFTNFDPLNSPELKHARVLKLLVDSKGTLWINTYDGSLTSWRSGIFRHEWRGWDALQMNSVFNRSNELIFATTSGELISRSGGSDAAGRWTSFSPAERTTGPAYRQDKAGVLWYYTREGELNRVVGTNAHTLSPESGSVGWRVNALDTDRSGNIWVGTDKGIAMWDGESFQNRTPTNGKAEVNITFLMFTRDGGCWAVADNRLRKFKEQRWISTAEEWGQSFGSYVPGLTVSEDRQGGTWFCHFGQGVFYAKPDGTFHRITSMNGLPGDPVRCWMQDHEGNVWLGVDRGGLVRLREKHFQVLGVDEGQGTSGAMTVCEDQSGALWIGTYGGGLNRWQHGKMSSFALPPGPMRGFIFSAYPDTKDGLWLSGGREDLYRFDSSRISLASSNVHGIKTTLVDRQGWVWLGKNRGLSRLSGDVLESFGQKTGFDYTIGIHALAEDVKGNIWAGADNGTLYEFRDGRFTTHRATDERGGYAIWSLLPDVDGTVWVGTFRGGLLRFKDGQFTRCTTDNGLPNDVICQILDDGAGKLWIGSYKGIFSVAKKDFDAFARGTLAALPSMAYGIHDGLPALECSGGYQPSGWRGRDGRLWFATRKGVVSILPEEMPGPPPPPPVMIEDLRVDGASIVTNSATLNSKASLRIAPGKHYLEFRYTALSYAAPDQVRFRYRIDGLEEVWIEGGTRREVHFSHLPPGNYRFRVTACNNDGAWNEADASLAFVVLPYFYETTWFRTLVIASTVIILIATVRNLAVRRMRRDLERLARQRAVERDRARIAQDIHDDLGAGLTRIKLESEMARRDPPDQVRPHLGQIADMAQGLTRRIDEIVWAVDPQRDSLGGFTDYATAYAEEFLRAAGIRCRIDLPAHLPELHMDAETRYNLFLCLKETLNNVVRHAQASEVWFRLRTEAGRIVLTIEDNGRGISDGEPAPNRDRITLGRGLSNLEQRLDSIGGRYIVSSVQGKGTTVEMTVRAEATPSALMPMGEGASRAAE
jgi:signal transduction histidine kinase/ligand-binding sensor domain-containing protein